jgi:tetratricopeptide (TPR) repeat protein
VKNYFLRKKNFEKATLAAFYEGRVHALRNMFPQALQAFLEAETFAEHISDTKRKGLIQHNIGWIHYTDGANYGEAIVRFKQAVDHFQTGSYYKYSIASLNLLGTCFLVQEQADSALLYQQQALHISVANHDTTAWAKTLQNISVTYRYINDNLNAKTYALQAIQLRSTVEQEISSILNLASIYYNLRKNDSAAFYANRILQLCEKDTTLSLPVSVYSLLTKIEKQNNDYKKALTYQEKYTELTLRMLEKKEAQLIAGIQEKYGLELVKTENQKLLIRQLWFFIIAFLIVLFLTGGFFLFVPPEQPAKNKSVKSQQRPGKTVCPTCRCAETDKSVRAAP